MKRRNPATTKEALNLDLDLIDSTHQNLAQLGIGPASAAALGIGYYKGLGPLANKVLVPVRNATGTLVGYAGLEHDGGSSGECSFLPTTFDPSLELYNLDCALSAIGRKVIVVQELLDAVKAHDYGIKNTVAMMGGRLSEVQEMTLVSNFERVILMFHGDDEGWSATQDAVRRLSTQVFVRAAILPSGKSPTDLTEVEFKAALQD